MTSEAFHPSLPISDAWRRDGISNVRHEPPAKRDIVDSLAGTQEISEGTQAQETVLEPGVPSIITRRIHEGGKFYTPEGYQKMVREREQSSSMKRVLAITRAVIKNVS